MPTVTSFRRANFIKIGIIIVIASWLAMRQYFTLTIDPNTLTIPVALQLSAIKNISMATATDAKTPTTKQYIPWKITLQNGKTLSAAQCEQTLPAHLIVNSLWLTIGGNKLVIAKYPLRTTFDPIYQQKLITTLTCIAQGIAHATHA